jgi:hypothetical protein
LIRIRPDLDPDPQLCCLGRRLASLGYKELNCAFPSAVMKDSCPNACACAYNRYYDEVTLNCTGRGMTSFPERLPARPSSSIWLHLENNNIADLPAAVRQFVNRTETNFGNIRYLFLSHNKIANFRQVTHSFCSFSLLVSYCL